MPTSFKKRNTLFGYAAEMKSSGNVLEAVQNGSKHIFLSSVKNPALRSRIFDADKTLNKTRNILFDSIED